MVIGVLSFQGSVAEHLHMLERLEGVEPLEVKTLETLQRADAMILPGGESTTVGRLLNIFHLMQPLRERILKGMPVWGTCAGMILLADRVQGETGYLKTMDITVVRNAYGRQAESFTAREVIPEFGPEPVPLVFVRAPWVESAGKDTSVLCRLNGHIVAVRQKNMLATSFHPELTQDLTIHRYFARMARALI